MGQNQSAEKKEPSSNMSEKEASSTMSPAKKRANMSEAERWANHPEGHLMFRAAPEPWGDKEIGPDTHLCFFHAFELLSKKRISWHQYLHHCLLHYIGSSHPDDKLQWYAMRDLIDKDPFGFGIWSWQHQVKGETNVESLEAVFHAYEQASVEEVKEKLSVLNSRTASILRRSLALLAIQDRKVDMLRFIMQNREQTGNGCNQHHYDPWASHAFEDAANAVEEAKEPKLFELINQSSWRKCNPNIPRSQLSPRGD